MLLKTKMIEEAQTKIEKRSTFKQIALFFLVFIISNIVMNLIVSMFTMVYMYSDNNILELITAYPQTLDMNALYNRMFELMTIMPEWLLLVNVFSFSFLGLGSVIYCKFIEKRTLSSMGLRKNSGSVDYLKGIIIGVLLIIVYLLLLILLRVVSFNGIYPFSPMLLILYLVGSLFYGLSQELLFHGYYMTSLAASTNIGYSIMMSTLMFAFLNMSMSGGTFLSFVNYFILGLLLGICVLKRGNIWAASALHGMWFFLQIALFGIGTDSTRLFNLVLNEKLIKVIDNGFGLHSGILSTLVLFLVFGLIILMKQNSKEVIPVNTEE